MQMEVFDVVLSYLQNLTRADVIIRKDKTDQLCFNGTRSEGDFNSHLIVGEIMCTSFLANWVEQAGKDPVLMQVVQERFEQLNHLFRYDEEYGWTHQFLNIRKNDKPVSFDLLPLSQKKYITRFLTLQHTSLERQRKLFYSRASYLSQEYKLRLTPTELLELSLSLLASGRMEGMGDPVTQIGTVRFLANCLGLDFPVNYDSLMYQLREREQVSKFMDELRKNLIAYLRKKKG